MRLRLLCVGRCNSIVKSSASSHHIHHRPLTAPVRVPTTSSPVADRVGSLNTRLHNTAKSMATITANDRVKMITVCEEERRNGKYSPETLIRALNAMNQDGLVLLKCVIPVEIVDKLNRKMCEDANGRIADATQKYNHGVKCKSTRPSKINIQTRG